MTIGRAFHYGEGVKENYDEAIKWLELATEEENAEAQYILGECCLKGFGVQENFKKAVSLLRASAAQDNNDAIEMLFENGFDLEEPDLLEKTFKNTGPVVEIFNDATSRARSLYSRTMEQKPSEIRVKQKANIIELNLERVERLNALMEEN